VTDPRFYDPTPLDPEARAAIRRILEGGVGTPEAADDDALPQDAISPPTRPEPSMTAYSTRLPPERPLRTATGNPAHGHG
jgi:hypothetical protein